MLAVCQSGWEKNIKGIQKPKSRQKSTKGSKKGSKEGRTTTYVDGMYRTAHPSHGIIHCQGRLGNSTRYIEIHGNGFFAVESL